MSMDFCVTPQIFQGLDYLCREMEVYFYKIYIEMLVKDNISALKPI